MNKQDIKEFLYEKPGYLKEGSFRLSIRLDASVEDCKDALYEVNKEIREKNKDMIEDFSKEDLEQFIVKRSVYTGKDGETREWVQYKYDEKQEQFLHFKDEFLNIVKNYAPSFEKKDYIFKGNEDPVCLEISLPDIHYGRGDVKELERNFTKSIRSLVRKARGFNIDRILLPIGNDGLNSDGMKGTTTKGTPQVDSIDWRERFAGYWRLLVSSINYLQELAKVEVIVVAGNHDAEMSLYIGEVLTAYYLNNPNVHIDNSSNDRKYFEYGENMIMFTHGEKESAKDMLMNMPVEKPEMFSRTKYHEVHAGHYHSEKTTEYKGIILRHLPSISNSCEWARKMGYYERKRAQAFIWNKFKGLEGWIQENID